MSNHEQALIEAYHAAFDTKDKFPEGGPGSPRYVAHEAISAIAALMRTLGYDEPRRYDGEGRKPRKHNPQLTMSESEAVEVFSALDIAARVHALSGNEVLSSHYSELNEALMNRGWS